jgi:hypothetical protein
MSPIDTLERRRSNRYGIPVALLFFNLGVQAGQLLFIGAVFTAVAAGRYVLRSRSALLPNWAWRIPPYAIGTVATFWVIDRTALFLR